MSALVVNMFAGPGAGKSTMRAAVFAELKWQGFDCEEAPEYAKDLTWEDRYIALGDQALIFGKQHFRVWRPAQKCGIIITDSPMVFSIIYNDALPKSFNQAVFEMFNQFDNLNYFIERTKPYNPNGRRQNEDEARQVDVQIKNFLDEWSIDYKSIPGSRESVNLVVDEVIKTYNRR